MWYAVARQVGTANKRHKYTIKLLSVENFIGRIALSFVWVRLKRRF
jgi:hypothetical protein